MVSRLKLGWLGFKANSIFICGMSALFGLASFAGSYNLLHSLLIAVTILGVGFLANFLKFGCGAVL